MVPLFDPVNEISKLEKDIAERQAILDGIKRVFARVSDAQVYRPDPNKPNSVICAASINKLCVDFDQFTQTNIDTITKEETRALYVWPYTTLEDTKVYSNPPYFVVATENKAGFGFKPEDGIEVRLEECELPLKLIRKVRSHLKSMPPITW